ncbi:MAG: GGDEF domain-containing protein [Bacteroides sp.]|nr:GGDEF domain-containing protein [Prevotella sp.]MCM1408880.1 GGDEF domain-containing protein [Treponema brennaborense]MCM1470859.1 GGDEF domain-containing protein [Bacteroides sp.]
MENTSSDVLSQFHHLSQSGMLESFERLKQENRELKRIIADSSHLIAARDVDSMLDFLISKFLDYFIPQNLIFMIKHPRKDRLQQYYYQQLIKTNKSIPEEYFYILKTYFDGMNNHKQSGKVFYFAEIEKQTAPDTFHQNFKTIQPKLIVPLSGINGLYGIIILSDKITGSNYSPAEIVYMHNMFSVLSITMQNGLHYETAITDPKTGLYTYDFFVKRIQETIISARRYKHTAGMLMLDIDFFKRINDKWGHLIGDKILVACAKIMQQEVRGDDCVARFGGEEFSILLSHCTKKSIFQVAERIRIAIQKNAVYEKEQKIGITVSIGCCVIDDEAELTPNHIFKRADKALYCAKEQGRNRCILYSAKMGAAT